MGEVIQVVNVFLSMLGVACTAVLALSMFGVWIEMKRERSDNLRALQEEIKDLQELVRAR